MSAQLRRVVITGTGASTPIGIGNGETIWRNYLNDKNGVKLAKNFVKMETSHLAASKKPKFNFEQADFYLKRLDEFKVNCLAYVEKSSLEYEDFMMRNLVFKAG